MYKIFLRIPIFAPYFNDYVDNSCIYISVSARTL